MAIHNLEEMQLTENIVIDANAVKTKLATIVKNKDLSRYIL